MQKQSRRPGWQEVVGADCVSSTRPLSTRPAFGNTFWGSSLSSAPSGLGGLGYALGVKLALPERSVIVTIGDGSFMYNPVVPTLALSDEHGLPLLILVFNNSQYAVMKHFHKRFYPDGVAVADDDYYGVNIRGPQYEESAAMIGGYGQRVEDPGELRDAITAAYASVRSGKTAVLNIIIPGDGGVR